MSWNLVPASGGIPAYSQFNVTATPASPIQVVTVANAAARASYNTAALNTGDNLIQSDTGEAFVWDGATLQPLGSPNATPTQVVHVADAAARTGYNTAALNTGDNLIQDDTGEAFVWDGTALQPLGSAATPTSTYNAITDLPNPSGLANGTQAVVYGDPVAANRGLYIVSSGEWEQA